MTTGLHLPARAWRQCQSCAENDCKYGKLLQISLPSLHAQVWEPLLPTGETLAPGVPKPQHNRRHEYTHEAQCS